MTVSRKGALSRAPTDLHTDQTRLVARFRAVRAETERLAEPLSAEDQVVQSMPDASPAKWHRAHTTWFFETFILKSVPDYREFHPAFSFLFNSYYEAVGARHPRPARGLLTRPRLEEIAAYRAHVDDAMIALLEEGGGDFAALVELGLHHEQQHQELLLTDILHAFAQNSLHPAYHAHRPISARLAPALGFTDFEGGVVEIGHDGEGFAFDNEGPRHRTVLEPYRLADRLISNGEWLEFMAAGGYRDARLWLADGWQCVNENGWSAPLYWQERDGEWFSMTLSGLQPLNRQAPVTHISFYEADAFARWRGKRLPSEAEWEHAALRLSGTRGNFRESGALCPLPASASTQMFGDCWEWTQSPYAPYPGFRAADGAVGEYNGKFMVNQLVLRGGSCVTPADHIRATYRNFFYPHQRWQFTGLRLAEDRPAHRARADDDETLEAFRADVLEGLARPQKRVPSKYFYDDEGSRLFEEICQVPEYYPTRTEKALFDGVMPELAELIAPGTALVEFGSGSCAKTRLLLSGVGHFGAYVPIEICESWVMDCAAELGAEFPDLAIWPIAADFMQPVTLPAEVQACPRLGFFPGSTIGNLTEEEALHFLKTVRADLGSEGRLLIGIDLVKDVGVLEAAYDDAAGVTRAFNKNMLVRINRELEGDFDPEAFRHRAVWNAEKSRIEMHLESVKAQRVCVAGRAFAFAAGETIHTENSHKYTIAGFAALAAKAGWRIARDWISPAPEFAVLLLE